MAVRANVGEGRMQNLDYTVTKLEQHIWPLKASVRIAVRPVGNPGTAEGKVCTSVGGRRGGR